MIKILSPITIITLFIAWAADHNTAPLLEEMNLYDVQTKLGDSVSPNLVDYDMPGVSAKRGEQLVNLGYTTRNGKKTKRQSIYFECTACHNLERVDPDIANPDPQERLDYAYENDIPFLQGSPFYGIVNRTAFYNGDYYKKYGDLVYKARDDIREAIQLCATECAQGRALKDWEIESVLAYFWELQIPVSDLELDETQKEKVMAATTSKNKKEKKEAIDLLATKYPKSMPASNLTPIVSQEERYRFDGDEENGKKVYETSCKHCHYNHPYSFLVLDDKKSTFSYLENGFKHYTKKSIYEITRWGTQPLVGKRAYMPYYTNEKLTDSQIKDLTTYIHNMAE